MAILFELMFKAETNKWEETREETELSWWEDKGGYAELWERSGFPFKLTGSFGAIQTLDIEDPELAGGCGGWIKMSQG